jgi:hypothetical protein
VNFASTGQTIAEATLFYQYLPPSVKTIVHVLIPETLTSDECIRADKYNAFYMYGYRPTPDTKRLLESACGSPMKHLMDASRLEQTFESRWAVQEAVDAFLWKSLPRGDANGQVERATNDLYFPAFQPVLSPEARDFALRDYLRPPSVQPRFALSPRDLDVLRVAVELDHQSGRQTVLVFAPLHPQMRQFYGDQFLDDIHALTTNAPVPGMTVIDDSRVGSASDFVDRLHLGASGAKELTNSLATALNEL